MMTLTVCTISEDDEGEVLSLMKAEEEDRDSDRFNGAKGRGGYDGTRWR